MLQETAFEVVRFLDDYGIKALPEYRNVRRGSVYHLSLMHHVLAEALFSSGFTTVDSDVDGYTPLMTILFT
ncbi:hypothetical protein, partial [Salmonella enterica]|uniref:hypothetical protein n=1 Tax=Salmonella enterica TaxID=28901 RepID=UPI0020C25CB6